MNTLVCPLSIFQRLLPGLVEDRQRIALARVGVNNIQGAGEWLVRDFTLFSPDTALSERGPVFRISLTAGPPTTSQGHFPPNTVAPPILGYLYLGDGPSRGCLWGLVRTAQGIEPLDCLFLVGAGMHQLRLADGSRQEAALRQSSGQALRRGSGQAGEQESVTEAPESATNRLGKRWSRTIGALGEEVWERLIGLHVVLVGCGRTGSVMAVSLTRLGIRRLTLIDPDCVELHNLGEMDALTEADLGTPKAEALARHLFSLSSPGRISILPLNASIAHPTALSAAKAGDVLVCCADNDAARLATGLIATLYHKVLLDIGTGIFLEDSRQPPAGSGQPSPIRIPNSGTLRVFRIRTMGADVRLIIPGDGCLLCRGNLTAYSQAVEDLCNHRPPARVPGEWRQERAGSLRSLNVMAAGLGVHMLQELVSERIDQSAWAHLEFDQAGQLTVQYPPFPRSNDSAPCALCVKAGLGNEGFWWARQGGDPEFPEANLE